jgi:hypothetical protein
MDVGEEASEITKAQTVCIMLLLGIFAKEMIIAKKAMT